MWETINNAVSKLTAWDIRAIIAIAVFIYLWLCARAHSPWPFRRDKQGHLYCYSHFYEVAKGRTVNVQDTQKCIKADIEELQKTLKEHYSNCSAANCKLHTDLVGIQLRQAIDHTPEAAMVIEDLAKEYFGNGGDGYMHGIYEEWKDQWEKKVIARRLPQCPFKSTLRSG